MMKELKILSNGPMSTSLLTVHLSELFGVVVSITVCLS